jgi:hypothetical protein
MFIGAQENRNDMRFMTEPKARENYALYDRFGLLYVLSVLQQLA